MEKVYTVLEVSQMLKVHEGSVRRWIYKGWLESIKVGQAVRITESAIENFKKKTV